MKCEKCGAEIEGSPAFCTNCGAPLNTADRKEENGTPKQVEITIDKPAEGKEKKEKKKLLNISLPKWVKPAAIGAGAVILIVLVIVLALILIPEKGNFGEMKGNILLMTDGETKMIHSAGTDPIRIDGGYEMAAISLDGTKALFVSAEKNAEKVLYFDGKQTVPVTEKTSDCKLSPDGSRIAYRTSDGTLWLYNGGSDIQIAEKVNEYQLSTDGTYIVYSAEYGEGSTGFIWHDGKSESIGPEKTPAAVSNDGKLIWYFRETDGINALSVQKGIDGKITKLAVAPRKIFFNRDFSQIIVIDAEDNTYLSTGSEAVRLASAPLMPVCPDSVGSYEYACGEDASAKMLDLRSFAGMYFVTDAGTTSDVYYADAKFNVGKVFEGASDFDLTDDGSTLFFVKDGGLKKLNVASGDGESEVVIDGAVRDYSITSDGKTVYYSTNEYEIYCFAGGNSQKLADDYIGGDIFRDGRFYFISNYKLFTASGKKVTKIGDNLENCNISGVSCTDFDIYLEIRTPLSEAISTDGRKFTVYELIPPEKTVENEE